MRKILSMFVALIMMLSVCSFAALVQSEDLTVFQLLKYENFEEGSEGASFTSSSDNAQISIDSSTDANDFSYNKTMYIKGKDGVYGFASMNFDEVLSNNPEELGANAYATLEFDMKADATESNRLIYARLYNASSTQVMSWGFCPSGSYIKEEKTGAESIKVETFKNKWKNIKMVFQLTDGDKALVYKLTKIYMNGTNVLDTPCDLKSKSAIARMAFSFQSSNPAWLNVDNISFIKYNSINGECEAAPDRTALSNAIKNYIITYDGFITSGAAASDVAPLKNAIESAKLSYNSADLTKEKQTAAINQMENAVAAFETLPYKTALDENFNASLQMPECITTSTGKSSVNSELFASDAMYKNAVALSSVQGEKNYPTHAVIFNEVTLETNEPNTYVETNLDIKPFNINKDSRDVKLLYRSSSTNKSGIIAGLRINASGRVDLFDDTAAVTSGIAQISVSEWHNIKVLMHSTDAAGAAKNTFSVYIDGVKVTDEQAYFNAPTSYSKMTIKTAQNLDTYDYEFGAYVDNISIRKYTSADGNSPLADMYTFKKAVKAYIMQYDALLTDGATESELINLRSAIDAAQKFYDVASTPQSTLDNSLKTIADAISDFGSGPDISAYSYNFDFDSQKNLDSFKERLSDGYSITSETDNLVYGINKYATTSSTGNYFNFANVLRRNYTNMNNLNFELEFDAAVGDDFANNDGRVAITLVSNTNRYLTGIQFHANGKIQPWWRNNTDIGIWQNDEWKRIKLVTRLNENGDISKKAKTKIYINGEYAGEYEDYHTISADDSTPISKIDGFRIYATGGKLLFDNIRTSIYSDDNKPTEKGELITKLRSFYKRYKADIVHYADANALYMSAENVYKNESATDADVAGAISNLNSCAAIMENKLEDLKKNTSGMKEIIIPGRGKSQTNVVIPFSLHYGAKEGNDVFTDLFFNGTCNKDFSNVVFKDRFGNTIKSEIKTTGNYDFIKDSDIGGNYEILHLSDGMLVSTRNNYIAFSDDNAKTWNQTEYRGFLCFVDRNDNIYYNVSKDRGNGIKPGIYKLSASDNYSSAKLVIDFSDAINGTEDRTMTNKPTYLVDKTDEVTVDSAQCNQDDDGYIYIGRYQTEWIGVRTYVSDESGENFKCVDWRLDKQHTHTIKINRNVYPNEVYINYDDTKHSPLCQRTVTHGGYDEIINAPNYDDNKYENVIALSQRNFTQVPIPYQNADYYGVFGLINKGSEYMYTAENGKQYTMPDNVYGIGCGESNILGGPSIYKTTATMQQSAYYPLLETTQGLRRIDNPTDGVLIGGMLSGRYAQTIHMVMSFDDGENWESVYDEGFVYSDQAGNGVGRFFTDYFVPKGAAQNDYQVLSSGYCSDYGLRIKLGGDKHYAVCYVQLESLDANGDRIYVDIDEEKADDADYDYKVKNIAEENGVIKSAYIEKMRPDNSNAVLAAASYNENNEMKHLFSMDIEGSGDKTLNIPDTNEEESLFSKLMLFDSLGKLTPFNVKQEYGITQPMEDVSVLDPVLHMKLNEGSGDTVTDAISGNSFAVMGENGCEWINADIRYGSIAPLKKRSSYALKLGDGSSINIGQNERLKNVNFSAGDSITIAFWTNTEVQGNNGNKTEAEEHLSTSYGNIRCGYKFSNQDNHVILHNSSFDFNMKYNSVFFNGNNISATQCRVPQPLLDTNYYNLYFAVVRGGETAKLLTYGNDQLLPASETVLENTSGINFNSDLYIGSPNNISANGNQYLQISNLGLADIMIFDRELTYQERLKLYHGINYYNAIGIE